MEQVEFRNKLTIELIELNRIFRNTFHNIKCLITLWYIFRVKVLFTFDSNFQKDFREQDSPPNDDYAEQVIALVKNAYQDKTLKNAIGTTINIDGTFRWYSGSFSKQSLWVF